LKVLFVRQRQDLPLGSSDISFQGLILLTYSHVYERDMYLRGRFTATRVRTDPTWRRALELATDNREATHEPTNHVGLESPMGVRREATQAG
jgi:hypothetical protein